MLLQMYIITGLFEEKENSIRRLRHCKPMPYTDKISYFTPHVGILFLAIISYIYTGENVVQKIINTVYCMSKK